MSTLDTNHDGVVSLEEAKQALQAKPAPTKTSSILDLTFNGCNQVFHGDSGPVEVIKNLTFTIQGFQTVAVMGPSGCGKSTVLRMVSGLYPRGVKMPTSGTCSLNGETTLGPRDEVLTVFQTPVLAPWHSVLGNVMLSFKPFLFGPRARWPWEVARDVLVAMADRVPSLRSKLAHSEPWQEIYNRSVEILHAVGLRDSLHKFPHQLSGGMRQRVALATSLVVRPSVLCMDEPFSALDPPTRMSMRQLVKDLRTKYPCLILFVTHDPDEAIDLASRVIVLSTRPASIMEDIKLPDVRPSEWESSPEHAQLQGRILHLIRDAAGKAS